MPQPHRAEIPAIAHPRMHVILLSLVLLQLGCANLSQFAPAPPQPPTYGSRFKVTIVSANIAELRPDGQPWHTQEPDASIPLLNTIASLSANPVVMAVAPVLFKDDKAGRPISPSPMVRMQAGAGTFETPTKRTDLAPAWEYPFAVDVRDLTPESPMQIAVIDADGRTVMDEFEIVARELFGKPETVFAGTSVTGLRVRVEPLPDIPEHQTYRFRVRANESLEDLAARTSGPRFAGDWMPVKVLNGDVVRIIAVGEVSPSSFSGGTCGPAGFENGHLSSYTETTSPTFHMRRWWRTSTASLGMLVLARSSRSRRPAACYLGSTIATWATTEVHSTSSSR